MARTSAALLVDSDLKGLESLVYGFQGVDWRSTACPAPETATFLVKASGADILVIAAREPYDKTLTLLRQLRSSEETRGLPLLVMGPASLRADVLDCGSIDFLPTPVFVRDAITASRILVSLGNRDSHAPGSEAGIDGTVAEFGLFSIIRVMTGLTRSGVLQVERANSRGEILFSEGEIAGAQVGSLQGPPAVHHLLLWEDAKIELRLRAVVRRAQFNRRFDQIMEEAERFLRDYNHSIQGIGPASSVYEKNDDRLAKATVPSDVTPVLRLCDGRRSLTDIIDESPFRVFDTVRILTRLVDVGVVARRKPADGTTAPTPPLQKFWETARIASPEDSAAPASPHRPTPARVAQVDTRVGDVNRRKTQRRASAETPVLGTPILSMEAATVRLPGVPNAAPLAAPVAQAPEAGKARASGTIERRATSDRRQMEPDGRKRPSVSIDLALVEAVVSQAPTAAPVETPAAPAEPPTRTGRVTGTMQVAPSSSYRRSAAHPQRAGGGISVEIDPALASDGKLVAKDDAAVATPPQSIAPTASPAAVATSTEPSATPLSSATASQTVAAATGVVLAPTSAPLPAAGGSLPPVATHSDGDRSARVTGTLSVTPSQRSAAAKTPGKGVSVELDPVLMAELGRLEKATTPVGPPESAEPFNAGSGAVATSAQSGADNASDPVQKNTSSPPKPGYTGRATGTLSVAPASRSSASSLKTPSSGISVALDPGLVAEVQKLDAPKPQSAGTAARGLAGTAQPRTGSPGVASGKGQVRGGSGGRAAPAAARPTVPPSDDSDRGTSQPGRRSGRISSAFNAVERDFFEREADLYKREAEDTFADLDAPASKAKAKGSPSHRPTKKQA